jgi:3'(2'), 5'-bisphosphate nucleotidase
LWDTAAAQCVVEQAGGRVIRLDGAPLSYADPGVTLNPHFVVHGKSAMDWCGVFGQGAAGEE